MYVFHDTAFIITFKKGGDQLLFKIKKTTPMNKLIDAYCKRNAIERAGMRFVFDGALLTGQETPVSLGLEELDVIDAFPQQTGGFSF